MIRIAITGASGRMGRSLLDAVSQCPETELGVATVRPGTELAGARCSALMAAGPGTTGSGQDIELTEYLAPSLDAFDTLIDFTPPAAALENLRCCASAGKSAVVGTTGFTGQEFEELHRIANQIPVVYAANFSTGVTLSMKLLETAAQVMGEDADIEIIETHHRNKADAPSGTALAMGGVIADALGHNLSDCAVHGREGSTGVRGRSSIGFSAVRGGDVVGDHTVLFAAEGERLEITHRASSRMSFARGAVRAAVWLANDSGRPGLYSMGDVLQI